LPATTLNSRERPFERLITPRQDIAPISANYRALLLFIINLIRGSFCALLLIVANPIFAQTEQTVDRLIEKDTGQINLALVANFLEDPTGALTLDEVVELEAQGAFKPEFARTTPFWYDSLSVLDTPDSPMARRQN
jgi:hypothetical protein